MKKHHSKAVLRALVAAIMVMAILAGSAVSVLAVEGITSTQQITNAADANKVADENGGRYVYIDFEDGTANDVANRFTPIVGSSVVIGDGGKDSGKAASITNTSSAASVIRWKQDEYDPFLYSENGTTISMWINIESFSGNEVYFGYGFFGYRFNLERSGDQLLISARNYDSTSSEFKVSGLKDLAGKGWTLLTVTCDANKVYTVYFDGKQVGQKQLTFSLYDIAKEAAVTTKRNTTDASNQYYGYYNIAGTSYNLSRVNMVGKVDDFAIYNKALSASEIMKLYDPNLAADMIKVNEVIELVAKTEKYSDTFLTDLEAARTAYNNLSDYEKTLVTNSDLLDNADGVYVNGRADANGGKYAYIDFEDGTANDVDNRFTPIVGSSVVIGDGGKDSVKAASITNTKTRNSMIRWKQDEYDPFLYSKNGVSISMWVNFESFNGNEVIFNYGFWGYRFILQRDGNNLLVSGRNYDSTTSEFRVAGLNDLVGKGWTLLTVTCDADKVYTVYFNGAKVGSQKLSYSLYDLAYEGSLTTKRNKTDENNNYYGYYSLGGAPYWADRVNMNAKIDDFALYNRVLTTAEIFEIAGPSMAADVIIKQIDAIGTVNISNDCAKAIANARKAYDDASDEAKQLVTNYSKLVDAEEAYATLTTGIRYVNNANEVTPISGPGSGNESYDKMFDSNSGTKFGNSNHTTPFIWSVKTPVTAKYYSMTTGGDSAQWTGRNPKTWTLYGCTEAEYNSENATWHVIDAKSGDNTLKDVNAVEYLFEIPEANVNEYQYYKLEFPNHNTWLQLSEFSLYVEDEADYSAVDAAIAEIPADLSVYSKMSVDRLNSAVNAIVRGLTSSEQSRVDAFAENIRTAIAQLVIDLGISIDISDGVSTDCGVVGRKNITWNANINIGENTLDEINSKITCMGYGVYYGVSEEAINDLYAGRETTQAKKLVINEGEDIDIYTIFGFRLKSVAESRSRAAMFYISYEYDGTVYTIVSDCVTAVAE